MNALTALFLLVSGIMIGIITLICTALMFSGKRTDEASKDWLTYEQYLETVEHLAQQIEPDEQDKP